MNTFLMVDLKELLGNTITRESNKICLDQNAYISTILKIFNTCDCKYLKYPLESNLDYIVLYCNKTYGPNAIGFVTYFLICAKHDFSLSVNIYCVDL